MMMIINWDTWKEHNWCHIRIFAQYSKWGTASWRLYLIAVLCIQEEQTAWAL